MGNKLIMLKVIPEPCSDKRNVQTISPPEIKFFSDNGDTNYLCGNCEAVLAEGIKNGILGNMVLKCNNCQHYNQLPVIKSSKKVVQQEKHFS